MPQPEDLELPRPARNTRSVRMPKINYSIIIHGSFREEGSFQYREEAINSISDYILINSRLNFCGERKPVCEDKLCPNPYPILYFQERAQSTRQCLKTPFTGYLQKHCSSLANCDREVASAACQTALKGAKAATCKQDSCIASLV